MLARSGKCEFEEVGRRILQDIRNCAVVSWSGSDMERKGALEVKQYTKMGTPDK